MPSSKRARAMAVYQKALAARQPIAPEPGFVERMGGPRGLVATGVRGLSGLLSVPGGVLGAGVAGGGETLAEVIEGGGLSAPRIATEAGLGAVPFSKIFKAGKVAQSALRGGLYSGVGTAMREMARDEPIDTGSVVTSTVLGAGIGGGLAKLLRARKGATTAPEQIILESSGGRPVRVLSSSGSPVIRVAQAAADIPPAVTAASTRLQRVRRKLQDQGFTPTEIEGVLANRYPKTYGTQVSPPPYAAAGVVGGPAEKARLASEKAAEKLAKDQKKAQAVAKKQRLAEIAIEKARTGVRKAGPVKESFTATIPGGKKTVTYTTKPVKKAKAEPKELATALGVKAAETPTARYAFDQPGVGPGIPVPAVTAPAVPRMGAIPETLVPPQAAPVTPAAPTAVPATWENPPSTVVPRLVSPTKVAGESQAYYPQEASDKLDELRIQYDLASPGAEKRVFGRQMAEIRDFFTPGKMRESWRGAQAETPIARGVAKAVTPAAAEPVPYAPSTKPSITAGEMTPEQIQTQLADVEKIRTAPETRGFLESLRKGRVPRGGSETGAIDPALLARLGLGAAGAAVGAATDPLDNPLASGIAGGVAGGLAPTAFSALIAKRAAPLAAEVLVSPALGTAEKATVQSLVTPEGLTNFAKQVYTMLPQYVRANLLLSPNLINNTFTGPWGSGAVGALEYHLAGDPRGLLAIQAMNPVNWAREFTKTYEQATSAVGRMERAEGELIGEATTLLRKTLAMPGTTMTMGDFTTRNILMSVGFTEAEARRLTLTMEPEFDLLRRSTEWMKGSPLGQTLLPFSRTLANIAEQGAERMPGLGFIVQASRKTPDPMRMQITQQGISAGLGLGAGAAGYYSPDDPLSQRFVRSAVSNVGGPAALITGMGYGAGQALKAGKTPRQVVGAGAIEGLRSIPLPTTRIPEEMVRVLTAEPGMAEIPSGFYPKSLLEHVKEWGRAPRRRSP